MKTNNFTLIHNLFIMKNLKLLFCLFALLGFVACSEDDNDVALKDYPVSECDECEDLCETLEYEVRDGKLNLNICAKLPIDITTVNYVVDFIPENDSIQLTLVTNHDYDITETCYKGFTYSIDKDFIPGKTYHCQVMYHIYYDTGTRMRFSFCDFDFTFTEGEEKKLIILSH